MKKTLFFLAISLIFSFAFQTNASEPGVVYEGKTGAGVGKHIVFLAGDHEYRSEESLPMLARILAKHHGFKCTVLFSVNKKTGEIDPGSSYIPGMEAINSADLVVIFLRFQNLPKEQMQPFADYLERGGPIVGLRTSTHAFKIPKKSPYAKYSFRWAGKDYKGGFGRQVLGETWAGHYGRNHQQSSRFQLMEDQKDHPVLRGVDKVWVQAGGYFANPMKGSKILAMLQPLNGMKPDSPADEKKKPTPGAWVRSYTSSNGKTGRVFTTTNGASEDILNVGFRRMLINSCFWTMGLEEKLKADSKIDLVGPYHPTTYKFKGHVKGVKPADLAGWETVIGKRK